MNEFLRDIQKAISDEWTAYHFYKELQSRTNNPLFVEFISSARQDEKKHYDLFQYLHYLLTGEYYEHKKKRSSSQPLKKESFVR